jgi:hypothetical protein
MFLRHSIKISSWLLLTVASFNFDRYQFFNDLFILLFYKRWSGRIPQTTKVSIHNLPFFFSLRKLIPTKIIESTVIGFTIINDALLRTLYAYMYVLKCARIINLFPRWYENVVSTLIWKCLDRLYWFFYLWCLSATFNNISAISWRPVCMSDEYASDNVSRKRF